MAENGVIGKNNDLPWHLPEDLKHFKEITLGKTVLMGRKTFESIVSRLGKPLPGRKNVVISRQADYKVPPGVLVFTSLNDAVQALSLEDIYVIGGAEIFKLTLPLAEKMYLTKVKDTFEGDAFMPEIDWSKWQKIESQDFPQFSFEIYQLNK